MLINRLLVLDNKAVKTMIRSLWEAECGLTDKVRNVSLLNLCQEIKCNKMYPIVDSAMSEYN